MNDSILYLILKYITEGKNISTLIKYGFSFGQLAECLSYLFNEGYITKKHTVFIVTEKGLMYLKDLTKKSSERWFLKTYEEMRTERLIVDDIYLP